jgi:hypothetical protein
VRRYEYDDFNRHTFHYRKGTRRGRGLSFGVGDDEDQIDEGFLTGFCLLQSTPLDPSIVRTISGLLVVFL